MTSAQEVKTLAMARYGNCTGTPVLGALISRPVLVMPIWALS